MNYSDALKYLNSFLNLEKVSFSKYCEAYSLERFQKLCDCLGRPQDDFKSVLVSGTKGKGSVCAILHSVLKQTEYKVGLYTSPHILDLRERVKINNNIITKKEFTNLLEEIKQAIKYAKSKDIAQCKDFTFFEILTAACFLYFSKKKIDIAILEVGLGGRLDATNIAPAVISAITPISYDHTEVLGATLEQIAKEKAGIIKENGFTICAPQKKEALNQIKNTSCEKNNKLYIVGKDIKYKCSQTNFSKTKFDYQGRKTYKNINLSLSGKHQAQNGAVALGVLEVLKHNFHFSLKNRDILNGFKEIKWPGRFDILNKKPYIIADGAHNKDSARALRDAVCDVTGKNRIDSLLLGISSDKNIEEIGSILCPLAKNVIFTRAESPRSASPHSLLETLSGRCKRPFIARTPEYALSLAHNLTPDDGTMLITGSLFLIGDVLKII